MNIVYNIVMILCLLFSIYFAITGLFTFKRRKTKFLNNKKHKFAILIPCRNEEQVIKSLIESIKKQDYPEYLYDCYAIPNNCTDNTKEVARKSGAKIIEIDKPVKSKGEVLKYTFDYLKSSDYDAYVIFDADNVVHKNFLKAMNDTLNEGYLVAQGFRDAKNPSDNYLTGSYTMFYYLQNIFYNQARMVLKRSSAINGTGFCIKKCVIDEYGFNVKTLTEDSEFTGMCALNNIKIAFACDAITYDEHPTSFKVSWNQRKRWSSGCFACLKRFGTSLTKSFWKNSSFCSFDCLLYYLAPIVQVISFALPLFMVIMKFIHGLMIDKIILDLTSLYFFILFYIGSIILNIIVIKLLHKKIKDHYKGILGFSLFILTWIPINMICLFKKTKKWEPVSHTRNVNIENILN